METVFIKNSVSQAVPSDYSSGIIIGPVQDKKHCGFRHTLNKLLCKPRIPKPNIQSFTTLAIAIYLADKCFARSESDDCWTREIKINIPINRTFSSAIPFLRESLCFLSGDIWQIETRIKRASIGARTYYKNNFSPDGVCLFSGGIDSLTGAINLLEEGKSIILVSHFETGSDANVQKNLFFYLRHKYGHSRVQIRSIQINPPVSKETSTRSRSFLFIALGLMVASAYGDQIPLYIPENGFVGFNIPLTGSRLGSYSTRTTHPAYLSKLRVGLQAASINHEIINPFSGLSKAEVLYSCSNPKFLKRLLHLTVSCAKTNSMRWKGHAPGQNCGFCYPCLIRRAALHSFGTDNPNSYIYDAIGSDDTLQTQSRGQDIRCLLRAVNKYRRSKRPIFFDILKSGSISMLDQPMEEITHPIETGFEEIITLISDKGCTEVRKYAGL